MSKIQLPVTLDSYNRKKDKSVRLAFTTTFEVNNDDLSEIDKHHGQTGWLLFKDNQFSETDIPDVDAPTDTKSPSERLRSVLYVYHMEHNGDPAKFRAFYENAIEKYINQVKEKLD